MPAAKSSALAVNGGSPVGAYLAEHGVGAGGVFIKFAKDGVYRKQSSFNISSERQARQVVEVIEKWYGPPKPGEAAGDDAPSDDAE